MQTDTQAIHFRVHVTSVFTDFLGFSTLLHPLRVDIACRLRHHVWFAFAELVFDPIDQKNLVWISKKIDIRK